MSSAAQPGRRPKGTFERITAALKKVTKMSGKGDVSWSKVKRAKFCTGVCDKLENLSIGKVDVVDGFLFQSFSESIDLPPMRCFEVFNRSSMYFLKC